MPDFVFKWLFFPLGALFLAGCQPIQLSSLKPEQATELLSVSEGPPANEARFASLRPSLKEFKEAFLSDKLDLVFVLDTSPAMESFYKKKLLGDNFLNRFQSYDWRAAWTDMSVDIQAFSKEEKQEESASVEEEEDSCGFLGGLIMAVAGIAAGQPIISGIGLERVAECADTVDFDSDEGEESAAAVFTNGAFLPFEHRGKKADFDKVPLLKASVENYNGLFDHSLRWGNEKDPLPSGAVHYEAPEKRESEPYPFLAMALSMARAGSPAAQGESSSFFRKDSLIVFVPITIKDIKFDIDPGQLKQSFDSFFGSAKRVKIIPIALSSNSSLICQLNLPKESDRRPSSKLRSLAGALGHRALDICSANLADELFDEISQSLYPRGFLSDSSF